ncbi:MAG: hypothetical protein PF637_02690 [Spirochaetes bacterium]|jgi:hypothetical protein|nr:hypothetical protein [Spirochaetota bacterium]
MKLLLNENNYGRRYRMFLYQFPLLLIVVSILIAFGYHSLGVVHANGDLTTILGADLLTTSFFQGSITAVILYFGKSRAMERIFKQNPSDFSEEEVLGFMPCVYGVWPYQYHGGFLTVEGTALRLYLKKVGGFVMAHEWKNCSMVKFEAVREPMNPFLPLIFNITKSIRISDGQKSKKILFSEPEETVIELNRFVKSI